MGLFNLFRKKKKNNAEIIKRMIAFGTDALSAATSDIKEHGTFLPFGATLTNEGTYARIVYHSEEEAIDPREHATIIQKIIAKRYGEANLEMCYMAFDGISHLKTGDIDSISIRVSHKASNTHKLFSYPYEIEAGEIKLLNKMEPLINDV